MKINVKKILFESDHKCYYCGCILAGENYAEMDHVIPKSRSGSDAMSNIVAACKKCNRQKRDKFIEEWRKELIKTTENSDFKFHFELIGLKRKGAHKYMDLIIQRPDLMEKYGLNLK